MLSFLKTLAAPALGAIGSLIGGKMDRDQAEEQQQRSYDQQKEFAQMGIRWKVADAVAAGLHPLAALGANTTSFSPISVGSSDFGGSLGRMGQDIGRAAEAHLDSNDRRLKDAMVAKAEAEAEHAVLQNTQLKAEIARQSQVGPGIPSVAPWMGQNTGPYVDAPNAASNWKPEVQNIPTSDKIGTTAGPPQALETDYIDPEGYHERLLSKNASEPYESDEFASTERFFNKAYNWGRGALWSFLPDWAVGPGSDAEKDRAAWMQELYEQRDQLPDPGPGHEWRYHARRGKWRRVPNPSGEHRLLY